MSAPVGVARQQGELLSNSCHIGNSNTIYGNILLDLFFHQLKTILSGYKQDVHTFNST